MSTQIAFVKNGAYTLEVTRFSGGEKGLMVGVTVGEPGQWISIALRKRQAIDICAKIIQSLNELGESS